VADELGALTAREMARLIRRKVLSPVEVVRGALEFLREILALP